MQTSDTAAYFNHLQEKTQCFKAVSASVGLRINEDKTKIMKVKTDSSHTVTLANGSVDEVEFT